jgi:hypothetical protein
METFITDFGKTIRLMGLESILTQTEQDMKATGSTINSMAKVRKNGRMVPITKATISLARKMDLEDFYGLTNHSMKAIL